MSNKIGKDTDGQVVINSLKDCKNCDNLVEYLKSKHGEPNDIKDRYIHLNAELEALKSEMDKEAFEQWRKEHQAMIDEFKERYPLKVSNAVDQQAQPSAQRQEQPLKAEDMPGPTYTAGGMAVKLVSGAVSGSLKGVLNTSKAVAKPFLNGAVVASDKAACQLEKMAKHSKEQCFSKRCQAMPESFQAAQLKASNRLNSLVESMGSTETSRQAWLKNANGEYDAVNVSHIKGCFSDMIHAQNKVYSEGVRLKKMYDADPDLFLSNPKNEASMKAVIGFSKKESFPLDDIKKNLLDVFVDEKDKKFIETALNDVEKEFGGKAGKIQEALDEMRVFFEKLLALFKYKNLSSEQESGMTQS
ncbi:MAG: hypothetical protein IBX55_00140 [Methyloprofundus sp.]|nr:hypothetical protein [Methyloprofundus sp.]